LEYTWRIELWKEERARSLQVNEVKRIAFRTMANQEDSYDKMVDTNMICARYA